MTAIEPRPLHSGWLLNEPPGQFEAGSVLDCTPAELTDFAVRQALGHKQSGWWECDLSDGSLTWTAGVYEIFGLAQGTVVTREDAVRHYCDDSRAAMERLRNHSIANRTGFVLDVRIQPANGEAPRWMRLIAAPLCEGDRVVRLHGLKLRL